MSLVRAHLPKNLMSTEALKALAISLLKDYIVKRLPYWTSTVGWLTNLVRNKAFEYTGGLVGTDENPEEIIDICCTLKSQIEDVDSYKTCVNVITTLLDKVTSAKKTESIYELRRIPLYFAIINAMQQIIKIQYPDEYKAQVEKLKRDIASEEEHYKRKYNSSKHYKQHLDAIHNNLYHLIVILGDNTSSFDADRLKYNPLPDLLTREQHAIDSAYLSETSFNELWNILETQLTEEQGIKISRDKINEFSRPNFNLHICLQVDYLMYFCDKNLGMGLGKATLLAVEADKKERGLSFRKILKLPEKSAHAAQGDSQVKVDASEKSADKYVKLDLVDKRPEAPLGASMDAESDQQTDEQEEDDAANNNNAGVIASPIASRKAEPALDEDSLSEASPLKYETESAQVPAPEASNNSPMPELERPVTPVGKASAEGLFAPNSAGESGKKLTSAQRKKLRKQQAAAEKVETEAADALSKTGSGLN